MLTPVWLSTEQMLPLSTTRTAEWRSSDTRVATVRHTGPLGAVVMPVAPGRATISMRDGEGPEQAMLRVTVVAAGATSMPKPGKAVKAKKDTKPRTFTVELWEDDLRRMFGVPHQFLGLPEVRRVRSQLRFTWRQGRKR